MPSKIQLRRGTAVQWTNSNPVLAVGEIGFVTDNGRFKIGDGATDWNALSYPPVDHPVQDWADITGKPVEATQLEMETGSETELRLMSPANVADAIATLAPQPPAEPTSTAVTYNADAVTTVDLSQAEVFHTTATGATTWAFTNPKASPLITEFTLELTNGGSQGWPASVKWDGGAAPTLSATGLDILYFYSRDGGTTWRGFLSAKGSA